MEPRTFHYGLDLSNPLRQPFMPMPDPGTGELVVDPEIELKAKGFGLSVSFFYSDSSSVTTPFVYGRSATV